MTSPSTTIVNPSPADPGVTTRRPRLSVFIDGVPLLNILDLTTTRGLDQDLASAEITTSHPLADSVRYWSKVQIVAGIDTFVERFTGYVTAIDQGYWPGTKIIRCQDVLAIAANKFTPEERDLHGFTDSEAVREVLFGCGYHESTFSGVDPLGGTGAILADVEEAQLFWEISTTGLEAIQNIDLISLGWRTYATAGGRIVRTLINTDPNTEETVHDFGEGVDIIDGSATTEIVDPKNEITVSGFDGDVVVTLDPADDPFSWWKNSYWIRFKALQTVARSAGTINPEDVALYILSQIGKPLIKVTLSTHLDILFQGQEVIKVTSEHLEVDQNFWVQSVQLTCNAEGWTQTITGVSALQPQNRHMIVPPVDTTEAEGIEPGDDVSGIALPPPTAPSDADILVDFAIVGIDKELAAPADLPDDLGAAYYVVTASDTSTSTQSNPNLFNRSWAASGPGVAVTSGTSATFTTAFTSLEGAEITLTLIDGNGSTATATHPVDIGTTPVRSRKLYALTPDTYEAYDGTQWRSQAPVLASKVQCVGGGPYWGADHYFVISADDLTTPPTETAVFTSGEDITCIWKHEADPLHIAVGGSLGSLGISTDLGVTWRLEQDRPPPNPGSVIQIVKREIIVSIHNVNELHSLTDEGWYITHDMSTPGYHFDVVREGDFVYLELSHTRNIVVTADGHLERGEDGTRFTRADESSPIVAATAMIRRDGFFAIAQNGTTWYTETDGSYELIEGEPIPEGEVLPGGAYRDGLQPDLVYFASQEGGIWKTVDGFKTTEGYLRLRTDGRLTP